MTIDPVDRMTASEHAARAIRAAVLNGTLSPGSRLPETDLANRLGISRGPLREALTLLEREGLVVRTPYRGAVVAEVSPETAREMANLRVVLEPWAVEVGHDYLTSKAGRAELLKEVQLMEHCGRETNFAGVLDAHLAFHRILYVASKNATLISIWQSWEQNLRLYLAVQHQRAGVLYFARQHRRLFNVIQAGDQAPLVEEFQKHFVMEPMPYMPSFVRRGLAISDETDTPASVSQLA